MGSRLFGGEGALAAPGSPPAAHQCNEDGGIEVHFAAEVWRETRLCCHRAHRAAQHLPRENKALPTIVSLLELRMLINQPNREHGSLVQLSNCCMSPLLGPTCALILMLKSNF